MKKMIARAAMLIATLLVSACAVEPGALPATSSAAPANAPSKIALLLPLNSAVGAQAKTIQDGFFSAYYRDRSANTAAPQVTVINTAGKTVAQAYDEAVSAGAKLIVGPLLKSDVQALQARQDLSVPVLALNSTDSNNSKVFEFSLSPQQEAAEVAKRAFADGRRNALIITPAGAWGAGIASAFSSEWQRQGGQIVDRASIDTNANVNNSIRTLLQVPVSKKDEPTTIQRRQDFDVVLLAIRPNQARQVKPLLTYYGASDIPVYATSLVYAGTPQPQQDSDLNGIIFSDMPWVFAASSETSSRLAAFGADAYLLAARFNNLNAGSITGQTGQLSLSANHSIVRAPSFGVFRDGKPQS